jgi:Lrp/AsnC family transcriptional regulator, leucine-responsive regulatory protein
MDDKDRLLIAQLRKDARRPIVALARDLGLSRTATQERLAKLVASGAIAKFTIEEGGSTGGQQSAHLLIKLEKGFKCAQVVPKLKVIVAANVIHSVAGQHDIIMRLDASDMAAIEAARAIVAAISGVAEVVTLVALERHLH